MEATNLSPVRISGSFVETKNGRLRREQRAIDKRDLQTAKKEGVKSYSIKRSNGDPTAVYEYKDIVYVINDTTGEEITSYAFPILLEPVPISTEMKRNYEDAIHLIKSDKSRRKSNTVIVVDVTGSMRKSDVWGTKTRLDAVWLSIALDFVAKRIESGAVGLLDVLSIVSLGPTSDVLISEEPISWIIYNKIVDFYNNKTITPHGHGFYMPSLDNVESLLTKNCNASCAIGLCFISDGQPSDIVKKCYKGKRWLRAVSDRFGSIAKKIARRLVFNAVGIGNSDDFETLRAMVKTAEDFGSKSSLLLPSMTSSALGDMFESFAISLTAKEIEINANLTRQKLSVTPSFGDIFESTVNDISQLEPRIVGSDYVHKAEVLGPGQHCYRCGDVIDVTHRGSLSAFIQNEAGARHLRFTDETVSNVVLSLSPGQASIDANSSSSWQRGRQSLSQDIVGAQLLPPTASHPPPTFISATPARIGGQDVSSVGGTTIGGYSAGNGRRDGCQNFHGRLFDLVDDGEDECVPAADLSVIINDLIACMFDGTNADMSTKEVDIEAISLMGIAGPSVFSFDRHTTRTF